MLQGVIVAAGLSSRIGSFKPLLPLGNRTIIENTISSMLDADVERVVLVLGFRGDEIKAVLQNAPFFDKLDIVYNPDYADTQMIDSIKIGVRALDPSCSDFFLLPGDIPAISSSTFRKVYDAHQSSIKAVTFPVVDGRRKHPPLISSRCMDRILSFQEDGGLRRLWEAMENEIGFVPVEDYGCTLDVDLPQDYERLLRYFSHSKT